MSERRYTAEEANALLPQVISLLERLRDAQRRLAELHDEVLGAAPGNGGGGGGKEYLEASIESSRVMAELNALEIVVRDPESGLIDFPGERDGREVFLCYRLGEERVAWWHPTDTGFAGRQPL